MPPKTLIINYNIFEFWENMGFQTKAQKGPKFDIITLKMWWPIKKKVDLYGIV